MWKNNITLEQGSILSLQAGISTLRPRHTKDAEPSRSPPCGFTPPINFTAGTLNFIGNVNLVVKKKTRTHTHTHGQWLKEALSKGRRHPEPSKDSGKYKREKEVQDERTALQAQPCFQGKREKIVTS